MKHLPESHTGRSKGTPELLCPAGEWKSLRAAVMNGADAVYVGLNAFNARMRAANFTPSELSKVVDFVHRHNVRAYVALNTLVFSDELALASDMVKEIAQAGADAIIVQDLGIAALAHRMAPTLPIHASTQMTLTEPRGIALAAELGVTRVILARELSLDDIRYIAGHSSVEIEVFVHGALCVSYSGQCLASESLGGRSANRGQCAQVCRLPYHLVADGKATRMDGRTHPMSTQDLAAYDLIPSLLDAGVTVFKIEGRLKGPEYVAAATRVYRAALDAALLGQEFKLSRDQEQELALTFSRGFGHGHLSGAKHLGLVDGQGPGSKGTPAGEVAEVTTNGVIITTGDAVISPGDGLAVGTQGGRVVAVKRMKLGRSPAVEVTFYGKEVNLTAIAPGDPVCKSDDPALRRRLEATYARDTVYRRIPLSVRVSAGMGESLTVTLCDDGGNEVTVQSPEPLAAALTHPLTEHDIREQFGRLGDTPFTLGAVQVEKCDSVMAPRSMLNELRRQGVAQIMDLRGEQSRHDIADSHALAALQADARARTVAPEAEEPSLFVLARTMPQVRAALGWRPETGGARPALVYCDLPAPELAAEAIAFARKAGMRAGLATPRILKPGEEGILRQIAAAQPDVILARNLCSLSFFQKRGAEIVADFSLNAANELDVALLLGLGARRVTPCYDLNWIQLEAMLARTSPSQIEIVIHQHMPMFHMEHCLWASFIAAPKGCEPGDPPCKQYALELHDRMGVGHPVFPGHGCRSTVFNASVQCGAEYVHRMLQAQARCFRIELLRETPEDVIALLNIYSRLLAGQSSGPAAWREIQSLSGNAITRGAWTAE